MKRRIIAIITALGLAFAGMTVSAEEPKNDGITILYENDVHCAVDGYAKLAAMKQELAETEEYVGVVSVGDYVQGSSLGAISQGEYIVNIMNLIGYDAVTLGNHEFDYKLPRLMELVEMMNTKPVCSNLQKLGDADTMFAPYTIVSYGETDIAYIGITTPDTLTSSSPAQFMDEERNYIYTFHGNDLYDIVQNAIDAAKAEGAEYVVGLSHLGTEDVYEQWSAQALVQNTDGFDVVLDGHSHSVVESMEVADENGDPVIITSTGTKFANIGKLTIDDGVITTELIETETYDKTDATVAAYIEEINQEYEALGERKIGVSEVNLTTVDEEGNRIVRNEETNLGDFCADAFRIVTGADIGFINGGGIRADMSAGDVTFNDILSVFPFNNRVCVIEVTGQQIVDMLELGVMNTPEEDGTFQHVSGITFDLNTNIPSSVKLDENMVFVSVDGERRISNVKVLNTETGTYEPMDLSATYTLSSHNYLLLDQGGGASMFRDAKVVSDSGMLDVELLEVYITEHLNGVITEEYAQSQGRIHVVEANDGQETPADPQPETPDDADDDKTEVTPETPGAGSVQTGDANNQILWMVMLVSAAVMVIGVKAEKRRNIK